MAFSGAWRRGAYTIGEPPDPEIDERHGEIEPDSPHAASVYTAPPVDDPGVRGEYPGADWVVQTAGTILDTTGRSHEAGDHATSQGADIAGNYGVRSTAFADERYTHERYAMPVSSEIDPTALQRGLNGLRVNNPEGWREGVHWPTWATRRFPIGERIHDERVLLPDTAFSETEGAEPLDEGAYPTSFATYARAITSIHRRPQARREPPAMLADEVDDGSPIESAMASDWVL